MGGLELSWQQKQVDFQYWNNILELVPNWSEYDVTNMNYDECYHNKKETAPSNNKVTGLKHILDNLAGEDWFYDQAHCFYSRINLENQKQTVVQVSCRSPCCAQTAAWDWEQASVSSSISCRNRRTVPEFESVHEYERIRLEFPYGKAACHSRRQNQLLPLASPQIQNSGLVMNLAGWAGWQLCGAPEERPAKCVCTCTGEGGRGFWSTAPQTEDRDTEREQGIGRVYMRVQQAKHAFSRISGALRLSAGLFPPFRIVVYFSGIKWYKKKQEKKKNKVSKEQRKRFPLLLWVSQNLRTPTI